MTALDLDAIRVRARTATRITDRAVSYPGKPSEDDFIAIRKVANQDVPALVAEVERQAAIIAGHRRIVAGYDELDALPEGSIVISGDEVTYTRRESGWRASWGETVDGRLLFEAWHTSGPVRVLFEPQERESSDSRSTGSQS